MKFLIVDDDAQNRRVICEMLKTMGHTDIVEAVDGLDAVMKFDASIGFIITDWNMPTMEGPGLIRHIRNHPDGESVVVVLVSGNISSDQHVPEDIRPMINAWMGKPINFSRFVATITKLISQ